jgi:hypothetical protein
MTNCNVLLVLNSDAKKYIDTLIGTEQSEFPAEKVSTLFQNASLCHIDSKSNCIKYIWRGINWSNEVGGQLFYKLKTGIDASNFRMILVDNLKRIKNVDHGTYTSDVFMPAITMFEELYEQHTGV